MIWDGSGVMTARYFFKHKHCAAFAVTAFCGLSLIKTDKIIAELKALEWLKRRVKKKQGGVVVATTSSGSR
jgi:hypothetical protein